MIRTGDMLVNHDWATDWVKHSAPVVSAFEASVSARDPEAATDPDFWPRAGSWMAQFRPYNVDRDGVLHVPVKGMLLNDFPYQFGTWATGYEYVRAALERGAEDSMVKAIHLDVNSGGGMVTGCFAAANEIYAARPRKPITAVVADYAYSAAYALASAAGEVVLSETGGVGSIGVVTYHIDASGAFEMAGLKKTYIYVGDHKVDGNETEALAPAVKAEIEGRLAATYEIFVKQVVRNRGLSAKAVRDTEARCYSATKPIDRPSMTTAIEAGLADRVVSFGDAFLADQPADTSQEGDEAMAESKADKTHTQADVDAAVKAGADAARAEGEKAGVAAERGRITAILGSEEAKTRPATALSYVKLGVDAADAVAALKDLPAENTSTARSAGADFKAEQEKTRHGLSANLDDEGGPDDTKDPAARGKAALALL